jgi:hypothetical protein
VTELAPYVQQHHPVPKIGQCILLNTTEKKKKNMFSESFDLQSERQASFIVEKSMPKL